MVKRAFNEILIVEDDEILGNQLTELLFLKGFHSEVAKDGNEALDLVDRMIPELVLLSLSIPKIDGYSVCHQIRKKYGRDELPIIALANSYNTETLAEIFNIGANDYVVKPVFESGLLARIRVQLAASQKANYFSEIRSLKRKMEAQRRSMVELELSRDRMRIAFDRINDPVISINHKKELFYYNRAAAVLFDLPEKTKGTLPMNQALPFIDREIQDFYSCWRQKEEKVYINSDGVQFYGKTLKKRLLDFVGSVVLVDLQESEMSLLIHRSLVTTVTLRKVGDANRTSSIDEIKVVASTLLQQCLSVCENALNLDRFSLMERAGVWTVQLEVKAGSYRCRRLNAHLKPETMPENPRWKNVLQVIDFLLEQIKTTPEYKELLKQFLDLLNQMGSLKNSFLKLPCGKKYSKKSTLPLL